MQTISTRLLMGLVLVATLVPIRAVSQDSSGAVSLENMATSPGLSSFVTVEGASVPDGFGLGLQMMFNYQYQPLVARECTEAIDNRCVSWSDEELALIKHRFGGELLAAVGLFGIFEAGLALPFVMGQTGGETNGAGEPAADLSSGGLEDLRLHLKLDILQGLAKNDGGDLKFALAFVPVVTFPVGNAVSENSFMGDSFITFHPKVAASLQVKRVRVGVNLGYNILEEKESYLTVVGSRITYGAAAEILITRELSAIVEAFGQQALQKDRASAPLEALGLARYRLPSGFDVSAGVGGGIIPGLGTPKFRVLASVGWTPALGEAAGRKQYAGENFSEMEADSDEDGVPNLMDRCPDDKEDVDGFEDGDGCPEMDNDSDGIEDGYDTCSNEAEDFDGFMDHDGCPELDNDSDGVPDATDQCPEKSETLNGKKDTDGCPDNGKILVRVERDKLVPSRPIRFKKGGAKISGKASYKTLRVVATILEMNPKMGLRIEGHIDSKGSEEDNQALSFERAKSVMVYLIDRGIEADRLEGQGIGSQRPIAENTTKKGRTQNNRVELTLTKLK